MFRHLSIVMLVCACVRVSCTPGWVDGVTSVKFVSDFKLCRGSLSLFCSTDNR